MGEYTFETYWYSACAGCWTSAAALLEVVPELLIVTPLNNPKQLAMKIFAPLNIPKDSG
jgi:hypothetical protein